MQVHRVLRKLRDLSWELKPHLKGVIVYGSYGSDREMPNENSDLDLAVIIEGGVDADDIDSRITREMYPIRVEPVYYSDESLAVILSSKMEYFMLRNIFVDGKMIYSKDGCVEHLRETLNGVKPDFDGFRRTLSVRSSRIIGDEHEKLRNLHRILYDCLAFKYYKETGEIPSYSDFPRKMESSTSLTAAEVQLYMDLWRLRKRLERAEGSIPQFSIRGLELQTYDIARSVKDRYGSK